MLAINLPQSKFKIGYEKKKIIYAQVDGARLTYNFWNWTKNKCRFDG